MNQNQEQLEQQLLEMHYGLLDDQEAAQLRELVETDATAARAWAQTLEMAGQFANAAKLAGAVDLKALDRKIGPPEVEQPESKTLESNSPSSESCEVSMPQWLNRLRS